MRIMRIGLLSCVMTFWAIDMAEECGCETTTTVLFGNSLDTGNCDGPVDLAGDLN